MQIYAISVLLLVTTTLGYRQADDGQFKQLPQLETTTAVNDLDYSVYSGNETPPPIPQFPEHMPTTGCFHHVGASNVDGVKSNSIDNFPSDQPASDPIPPQFNTFVPLQPFNRPMSPSYAPQPFETRNYYPFNRPAMPFNPPPPPMPFSPYQRLGFPNQANSARPIVIVKLLQPIILPVAKPLFPEGGERNPDDVDSERFTASSSSFPRGHRFGGRRFGAEKYRSVERPLPYRQQTFGSYRVGGEENIHVTVKLH